MGKQILLPRLTEAETETTAGDWLVAVGDTVEEGTPIMVAETEKAAVDVEASMSGTVIRLLVQPGDPLTPGQPILEVE